MPHYNHGHDQGHHERKREAHCNGNKRDKGLDHLAAPKYKLIYFDLPALAEPIRWMFAYTGVPFEDYRIKERPVYITRQPGTSPEWDALKSQMPYGTIPVLEVNGQKLGGQHAIARYVARKVGLTGTDDWEEAQADSIITYISSDFDCAMIAYLREMDEEKKPVLFASVCARQPKVADILENILRKNAAKHDKGFFVGGAPTVADFMAVAFYDISVRLINKDSFAKYPLLTAHNAMMKGLPGVKEFIAKHAT